MEGERGEERMRDGTKSKGYILSCGGKLGVTTNTTEETREGSKAHSDACTDTHAHAHNQHSQVHEYTYMVCMQLDTHFADTHFAFCIFTP